MYVQNEGQFSTMKTLTAYYSVFILMVIFNTYINKNKNFWAAKNLLGIQIPPSKAYQRQHFFYFRKTITEIVLNSLSSILSYNHFKFDQVLRRKKGIHKFLMVGNFECLVSSRIQKNCWTRTNIRQTNHLLPDVLRAQPRVSYSFQV